MPGITCAAGANECERLSTVGVNCPQRVRTTDRLERGGNGGLSATGVNDGLRGRESPKTDVNDRLCGRESPATGVNNRLGGRESPATGVNDRLCGRESPAMGVND